MVEPAKPFACTMPDCGMSFTNEDHLHVHTKKHDMVLQLGLEQKAAFVADQTPTPTRFIRNCEEVGLFQDLQNVAANPFDEGFKRAMEAKPGMLSLEATVIPPDDALHTPHFPLLDTSEATLFTNNQRNVTISRSCSDESGATKGFQTRTISQLTNEVTTISRFGNEDVTIKQTEMQSDVQTVCYKNNVITIESNVIKKDDSKIPIVIHPGTKTVSQIDNNKLLIEKIPIMSQKSIDFVVDNLNSELNSNLHQTANLDTEKNTDLDSTLKYNNIQITRKKLMEVLEKERVRLQKNTEKLPKILPNTEPLVKSEIDDNFEVHIKLPNGKSVRMAPVKETKNNLDIKTTPNLLKAKERIRNKIANKTVYKKSNTIKPQLHNVKISSGTLIPVTLVNTDGNPLTVADLSKVPITKICNVEEIAHLTADDKVVSGTPVIINTNVEKYDHDNLPDNLNTKTLKDLDTHERPASSGTSQGIENKITDCGDGTDDCFIDMVDKSPEQAKRTKIDLESRSAASKRYRERLKVIMNTQAEENKRLREANQRLIAEKAVLKLLITEHVKKCPNGGQIADQLSYLTKGDNIL